MAAAALSVSLLLSVCGLFTPSSRALVLATSFVPLALIGYAVAALGWWAVRRLGRRSDEPQRRRVPSTAGLVASVLGLGLHLGLLAPSYAGDHASGRPDLTVITSNLRYGLGDITTVTALAEHEAADVVVLEEVTPTAYAELAGLRQELPYVAGRPMWGARGTVVLSRYRLDAVAQLPIHQGTWQMQVEAPRPFSLLAVHTSHPANTLTDWLADHRTLREHAASLRENGPLVMAGDFNATLDHRPMRSLLGLGLADAARQSNAGWQPTWPGGDNPDHELPLGVQVMAIDHVLVSSQFSSISTSTHSVLDSDHLALVARLAYR